MTEENIHQAELHSIHDALEIFLENYNEDESLRRKWDAAINSEIIFDKTELINLISQEGHRSD